MKLGIAAAAALVLLAGCTPRVLQEQPQTPGQSGPPPMRSVAGLEGVLGRTAAMVVARLGRPALDIHEGDARKLQFESPACILDTYLYRPAAGGEPIVTHIDARLPDGRDMDRASCIAALQAQQQVR